MKLSHIAFFALALSPVACGGSPPTISATTDDAGAPSPPAPAAHPGPTGSVCTAITDDVRHLR